MAKLLFFISALLFLASSSGSSTVVYEVFNKALDTPGGLRFNKEIGLDYSKQVLTNATDFIWNIFQENLDADRKDLKNVYLYIDNIKGVSFTFLNDIHLSGDYIQNYPGDVKLEVTGILFHEMTHVWQWTGNSSTPDGLIEGIADFVRLKAGFASQTWKQAGEGDQWDEGFDVTARFLDYCDGLKVGFVAELNKKMRDGFSENYFVDLLGKSVDQLWGEYKAKHKTWAN